jgi:hypothetical protein
MTTTIKVLVPIKQIESAQTSQYTATNCKAVIDKCTVTNVGATNISFSINVVTVGGTAGATNLVIKDQPVAPGRTYTCPELIGHSLEAGDFISAIASTAASLNLKIDGREIV